MKIWIILIVSLLIIIPVLIIFLWWLGVFRCHDLKKNSLEKYIENYKKLKKVDGSGKVIISLSTTPSKIQNKKFEIMLKSILDQTVKVNKIYLHIPENKDYEIPEEYNKVLKVLRCGKDYGVCSKFVPMMLKEDNADTIIIILKDNLIYGRNYIEKLIKTFLKHPEKAIVAKSGTVIKPNFIDGNFVEEKNDSANYNEDWIISTIQVPKRNFNYIKNFKL